MTKVLFVWEKFANFQEALKKFKGVACIYVLTDKDGRILRIGESGNLRSRYRGGTGWMVEADMHGSGNLVFVTAARIEEKIRKSAEALLTFRYQASVLSAKQVGCPLGASGNRTHGRSSKRNGLAFYFKGIIHIGAAKQCLNPSALLVRA